MIELDRYLSDKSHIIWDWNGTLLDDVDLCVGLVSQMLAQYRLPTLTRDEYRRKFRFPVIEYYAELGFDFSKLTWEKIAHEFIALYQSRMYDAPLYPGAVELLERVRRRSIGCSILSASQEADLVKLLAHHGIRDYFDHVFGLDHIYATSKVELGQALLAEIGVAPEAVVMVGDTDHDIEVAESLGVDILLFPDGHQVPERLMREGVTLLPARA